MINKKIETALNKQIEMEAFASNYYLAAASWADTKGLQGCAAFMYRHADEERMHMMKLFNYINDTGGHAMAPAIKQPPAKFKSLLDLFQSVLNHEIEVTSSINNLVDLCMKERDHSTNQFLQWYVAEQHEEETLFRNILDKINLIGDDPRGSYWIDKEMESVNRITAAAAAKG